MKITKTDYLSYLDAPRHLWAIKHNKLDLKEKEVYAKHLLEQGYEVEKVAVEHIKKYIIKDNPEYILQPEETHKHYEARTDALVKNPKTGKWDIYEIKSSKKVKKVHKFDVGFQYLVFKEKYDIGDIYILHLNKDYRKDGELDLKELFVAVKVNEYVEKLKNEILEDRYAAYLCAKEKEVDNVLACIKPKDCPCLELCHSELPKYSIYNVRNLTKSKKKIRDLEFKGIKSVSDIPKDFEISEIQRLQVNVAQSNRIYIDKAAILDMFSEIVYPLYFLDYEAFNPAIPIYDGYSPYNFITFQYSLHVMEEKNSTELKHYDYLEVEQVDPIDNLLGSLEKVIGDKGSIVIWNETFEGGRNDRMGEIRPKYKDLCENMNNRIFDLMQIFKEQYYADPKFKGSYSIKNVLPVLAPEFSYEGMEIGDGATAMVLWEEMVFGDKFTEGEKAKISNDLLEYCKLDTLAMVEIFRFLVGVVYN